MVRHQDPVTRQYLISRDQIATIMDMMAGKGVFGVTPFESYSYFGKRSSFAFVVERYKLVQFLIAFGAVLGALEQEYQELGEENPFPRPDWVAEQARQDSKGLDFIIYFPYLKFFEG